MAQRCTYCGKTEKQHKGKPCFDTKGFVSYFTQEHSRTGGEVKLTDLLKRAFVDEDTEAFTELLAKLEQIDKDSEGK